MPESRKQAPSLTLHTGTPLPPFVRLPGPSSPPGTLPSPGSETAEQGGDSGASTSPDQGRRWCRGRAQLWRHGHPEHAPPALFPASRVPAPAARQGPSPRISSPVQSEAPDPHWPSSLPAPEPIPAWAPSSPLRSLLAGLPRHILPDHRPSPAARPALPPPPPTSLRPGNCATAHSHTGGAAHHECPLTS